jgi:hypothetical protein
LQWFAMEAIDSPLQWFAMEAIDSPLQWLDDSA